MAHGRHTVTDIVAAVYCEQKVVFDHRFGKRMTAPGAQMAKLGTAAHAKFEREGLLLAPTRVVAKSLARRPSPMQAGDSRCFIASQVYGIDARETNVLRCWRDQALLPRRTGRLAIGTYYAASSHLARLLPIGSRRARWARRLLDRVVARVERDL